MSKSYLKKARQQKRALIRYGPTTEEDRRCFDLTLIGQSNKAIQSDADLSDGQIGYRLREWGIKRWEYRNGTSRFAQRVFQQTKELRQQAFLDYLRTHAPKGK